MPLPDPSKLNFQLDVLGTLSPSGVSPWPCRMIPRRS
jgi:hypothetical protein